MKSTALLAFSLLILLAANLPAQDAPPPAPAAPTENNPGDRMEQFRKRMNERVKTELKATDEEWSIIQPLLEKVQVEMRKTMSGRFGGGDRRGGGFRGGDNSNNNGGNNNPGSSNAGNRPSPFGFSSPEADALRKTLEAESSSPAEIKAKLQALRDFRKQAAANLEQSQEELRKVLSQRQEATLVLMGILQ